MPVSKTREYRSMIEFRAEDAADGKCLVRGYASTFEPYVLFSDDGVDYYERIDPHAFDGTDMSDVIMQYDHCGPVFARTSNSTLTLGVDAHGLFMEADLSSTARTKELYEEIRAGLITKMSFAFTVDRDSYDQPTHTRTVEHVKKLYDVSAVSLPANPGTEIGVSARDLFHGVMEAEKAERLEAERKAKARKVLALRLRLGGEIYGN
jgi:HK97 family phage prohead protease